MKLSERRMGVDFTIGSALDQTPAWSFEEEKTVTASHSTLLPEKHQLVLKMEKRQGKPVSIVGPFFLENTTLKTLCATLKKRLGSGGTCKENWLEFQGECRDKIKHLLQSEKFRFKA